MSKKTKLVTTYLKIDNKYFPAYKIGENGEPKLVTFQGYMIPFDTPEEAISYLNE